uniref:Uncharacterized protein n=1 Tax=Tanacetum cinerariifolium TaxID=118510 RepID=A0A6L2JJT7_TANCI|nr:hypothetical protein [Tanacetum cinerariifolium]
MKGLCKSLVELEYFLEEVYKATTNQLDWNNPESRTPSSECFLVNVYKKHCIQRRVKDLQLGVKSYQKKLNLTRLDTYRSDLKRLPTYLAYSNPQGFIYQNKDKKNKLMRIDELHKFSDGTLNDVWTAFDDILKRIKMKCLRPQTFWKKVDKERAGAMIQAIDKQLKNRRIMRSLEKFMGRRPTRETFGCLKGPYDLSYDVLIIKARNPVKEILLKLNLPDHRITYSLKAKESIIVWDPQVVSEPGSQITDNSKKGLGYKSYHVVSPPPTGLFSTPKIDLSYYGLEEFQQPEFESYGPKSCKIESKNARLFSTPKIDLSYYGLEEFQQPEFESYGPKSCKIESKNASENIPNELKESTKLKESFDVPLVKKLVSDDKL